MINGKVFNLEGMVTEGSGEAGQFMTLDWVKDQCQNSVNFEPFPGTLNLKVKAADFDFIRRIASARGKRIIPPASESGFCEARLLYAEVRGISAALLYPMVDDYYTDILEIIAPVKVKPELGLQNGDRLGFSIYLPDQLNRPGGIIFDLDGTLIDSVDLFYSMLCEGFQEVGIPLSPRDQVMKFMGSGARLSEAWQALELDFDQARKEELFARLVGVFETLWESRYEQEVRLFTGVEKFLQSLISSGIVLGVVTSSFYKGKMDLFARSNLDPQVYFSSIVTGPDTANSKPHPEPVQLCLKQMGINPGSVFLVGDSPCDIDAGSQAGLFTVGVLSGAGTRSSLSAAGADLIVDGVVDLAEHILLEPEGL